MEGLCVVSNLDFGEGLFIYLYYLYFFVLLLYFFVLVLYWPESRVFATLSAELTRKQRLDGKLDASLDDCMRGATKDFRRRMCLGIHEARVRWSAGVRWPAVGSRVA